MVNVRSAVAAALLTAGLTLAPSAPAQALTYNLSWIQCHNQGAMWTALFGVGYSCMLGSNGKYGLVIWD